jgi:hypothetical protein
MACTGESEASLHTHTLGRWISKKPHFRSTLMLNGGLRGYGSKKERLPKSSGSNSGRYCNLFREVKT